MTGQELAVAAVVRRDRSNRSLLTGRSDIRINYQKWILTPSSGKKLQKSHKNVQKRIGQSGKSVISDDPYGFEMVILGQCKDL